MAVDLVPLPTPDLPPGFEALGAPGVRVWARAGLGPAALAATDPARGGGGGAARGRVRFGELGGERVAIRHYFRGGLPAHILGDLHLDGARPLHELGLYAAAAAAGVPTLEPLAGVARRVLGPFWRCDLVTRAVAGARDLGELAAELAQGSPRRRAAVIAAAARAVRALHEAGFEHADLNLKNILAREEGGARALVIDLDGAKRHEGPLPEAARRGNLLRLYRSSQKLAGMRGGAGAPARADLVRFARAYAGPDEAAWRALARLPLPRHRLRRALWAARG